MKNNNWKLRLMKGQKAERIVAGLFREAGFEVINYGYEHTVPELLPERQDGVIKGKAAEYIRHQPDFVVVDKDNNAFFVEVKFRASEINPKKEIFPYPNCYVVLLTKDYILAQSTTNIFKSKGKLRFRYLNSFRPFKKISNQLIYKYTLKTRRALGEETWHGQQIARLFKKHTNHTIVRPKGQFVFKK